MSTINNPDTTTIQVDGAIAAGAGVARVVAPVAGRILGATACVGTAPTGADLIVDVNVAGTSIYAAAGDQPTIAATEQDSAYAGATADDTVADFAAGDVITVDVDQVGSTVAGSDLTIALAIVGDTTP